ncbi:looped-hinge helix DNA binding domain, AbrB family [Aciduliprofundum sp. MAR08-339]|uniref:AbrB/MazE/SpoVT family DNA-binding domain-containing protein n=1 Tax=Aciduliprofundum sp. (strain MAR08-339) TaxID=673860 RepID=UPI0002A48C47|nr:looped-hinge helix DNA binding domain, AbrB family [Aciduliprofundum sp. MAR08-339]AGB04107.1 looped-hinge helix DNA binding domain, AbrB family [Aciduliprofundum sp. MAR08-339]
MELVLKVQELGRIAIPKHVREILNIEPGDIVKIEIKDVIHTAQEVAADAP